jgi:hypothetical protein
LATGLVILTIVGTEAASKQKQIITCRALNERHVKFDVPAKLGDLSKVIDFDCPAKATRISFRETICHLLQWTKASPRVFA